MPVKQAFVSNNGRALFQLFSGSSESEPFSASNVKNVITTIDAPLNSWKTYTHTFQPRDPDYVSKYLLPLLKSAEYPILQARVGLVAGGDAVWWPKEDVVLISHSAYTPAGQSVQQITVKFADRLWLLSKENRSAAWSGKISDIIESMWSKVGGTSAVVEPTALTRGQETAIWYQAFKSFYDFIKSSLLPKAQNAKGAAGYRLFVRDGVLRFHTQGYQSDGVDIAYTSGSQGFKELSLENRSIELSARGSSVLKQVTYDPTRGIPKMLNPSTQSLIKFAGAEPNLSNVSYNISHVGQNRSEQASLQANFSYARVSNFQASLNFDNCLDLRPGMLLSLGLLEGNGPSINTGTWHIEGVVYTIDRDAISGKSKLVRGEYNDPGLIEIKSPDSAAAQATSVQPSSLAQGKTIKIQLQ